MLCGNGRESCGEAGSEFDLQSETQNSGVNAGQPYEKRADWKGGHGDAWRWHRFLLEMIYKYQYFFYSMINFNIHKTYFTSLRIYDIYYSDEDW